jgi:hypothetical protein
MRQHPITGRHQVSVIDYLSRQPRVVYLDAEPAYPNTLVFAAGVFCGVLSTGASILLWTLV